VTLVSGRPALWCSVEFGFESARAAGARERSADTLKLREAWIFRVDLRTDMNRRAITTFCAISSALFLLTIGILHGIVNVLGLRRAIERGEIPARLGDSVLVNAAFSGAAMSVLGLFVLLLLPGIRAGSPQAGRVATAIGIFTGVVGAASYLWVPTRPSVLIFLFFGALLAAPLLIWRREFSKTRSARQNG
jgi:lysylphosphatidylglycerol synthetase-like protein (DUF2156 family)